MTQAALDLDHWLDRFVDSALAHDLDRHMALISREVMVFGVPGFETLGFDDWRAQCADEFPQRLLTGLSYKHVVVRTSSAERILFKALETTRTATGEENRQGVEMLLQREDDEWRLTQLRMLPADEARHDRLM